MELPIEFECTIVVACDGTKVLVTKLPNELASVICLDGCFLDDNGWGGLPDENGVYNAKVRSNWGFDEPETTVVSFKKTSWKVIADNPPTSEASDANN